MSMWVKIDDGFYDHPKVVAAGGLGTALFVCALSYSARHLTDGFIPAAQVRRLVDVEDPGEVAARLVEVGLWEEGEGGYWIHDYLDYNPSAAEVGERRAKRARGQRLYDDPYLTRRVKERDGNKCRYCGGQVEWNDRRGSNGGTYDHVDPEGANSEDNLVVACRGCNSRKGGRTPEEAGMELLPLQEGKSEAGSGQIKGKSQVDSRQKKGRSEVDKRQIKGKSQVEKVSTPVPVPVPKYDDDDDDRNPRAPPPEDLFVAVCRMYESEIGDLTPEVRRQVRELLVRYPDLAQWVEAFGKMAGANVRRLDYLIKCVESVGKPHYKKPK